MKAIVYSRYGPPEVLRLEEVADPVPGDEQVLLRVHAASINAADYRIRSGLFPGIRPILGLLMKPVNARIGADVAGRVVAVGARVTRFRPGDDVFGCADGSLAELALARETHLSPKPPNRSYEEAAAVPLAGLTALQAFRAGEVRAGQRVMIHGASGGVGSLAIQLGKTFETEVTAVCSPKNVAQARSLGADHVVDYAAEDFARGSARYDLILGVNGSRKLGDYRRALAPGGTYVCVGGALSQLFEVMLLGPAMSWSGGRRLRSMGIASVKADDLAHLGRLLEAGRLTPAIDRRYALRDVVAAFRYVEDTHARGKVIVIP